MNHADRIRRVNECLDPHVIPPLQKMITDYLDNGDDRVEWSFRHWSFCFEVLKESGPVVQLVYSGPGRWTKVADSVVVTSHPRVLRFVKGTSGTGFRLWRDDLMYLLNLVDDSAEAIGTLEDFEAIKALLVRCGIADW